MTRRATQPGVLLVLVAALALVELARLLDRLPGAEWPTVRNRPAAA